MRDVPQIQCTQQIATQALWACRINVSPDLRVEIAGHLRPADLDLSDPAIWFALSYNLDLFFTPHDR